MTKKPKIPSALSEMVSESTNHAKNQGEMEQVIQMVEKLSDNTSGVLDEFYKMKAWIDDVDHALGQVAAVRERLLTVETWIAALIEETPAVKKKFDQVLADTAKEVDDNEG